MGNKGGKETRGGGHRLGGGAGGAGGNLSASERAKVQHIVSMGFDASPAVYALRSAKWDVQDTVALLVSQASTSQRQSPSGSRTTATNGGGNTLGGGNAREGSRREAAALAAERRAKQKFGNASSKVRKTTSKGRAERAKKEASFAAELGKSSGAAVTASVSSLAAASTAFQNTSTSSRATASRPAPAPAQASTLVSRNPEERIKVLANMVAKYPPTVDTLVFIITAILDNPGVQKYRELKTTNKRFTSRVGASEGHGERFLTALGFSKSGEWLVLSPRAEDKALLWLGKACLEKIKNEITYIRASDQIELEKALSASAASADEEEAARRKTFESKVVPEPEEGSGGTTRVMVKMGPTTAQRRFCADDSVENIVCWLGATQSSLIPPQLENGEWTLCDCTLYPERVLDYSLMRDMTLQAAKLWPSCELELRPKQRIIE